MLPWFPKNIAEAVETGVRTSVVIPSTRKAVAECVQRRVDRHLERIFLEAMLEYRKNKQVLVALAELLERLRR